MLDPADWKARERRAISPSPNSTSGIFTHSEIRPGRPPQGPLRYRLRFTGCILRFLGVTIYCTEVHQRRPFCRNAVRKLERRSLRWLRGCWGTSEQPTILKNFPVFVPFYLPKRPLGLPPSLTSRYEPADAPRSNLYSKLLHLIWKSVRFSPRGYRRRGNSPVEGNIFRATRRMYSERGRCYQSCYPCERE